MHDTLTSVRADLRRIDVHPDQPRGRLLYMIHELSRLINTGFDQAMAAHRLTHSQWWALLHIYENEGTTQSDLANLMQMGRASAGKLLERMEAKNWIERRPDPADNRVRRVYLAPGVLPVFRLMREEGQRVYERLLGDLSPQREGQLLKGLAMIRRNAEEGETQGADSAMASSSAVSGGPGSSAAI